MKKIILLAVILFGLGITISPALAYTPNSGDLIKTTASPAVYYIDSNGYRHLFPTQTTFFSWYTGTWADQKLITISEADFLTIPSGKNVTIKPGYSLIRFDNSLKMYAVLPSGKLCRAPAHYGNFQYKRALVIPAGFETDYYNDGVCDITESQKLPDGTLLRYSGSGDVYYIQNNQKRKILENGFSENNFYRDSIIENVSWSMSYADGSSIYGHENSISSINNNFNNNYSCRENWSCNNWSTCTYNKQYRTCWDNSGCGTTYNKPIETQSCYTCTENWSCTAWSICSNGLQRRSCLDTKQCGTITNKPIENQTCR